MAAREMVAWYNGHPEAAKHGPDLGVEDVVILGNVSARNQPPGRRLGRLRVTTTTTTTTRRRATWRSTAHAS